MRKTVVTCLATLILASGVVRAQSVDAPYGGTSSDVEVRRVSSQLLSPTVVHSGLSLRSVPALRRAPFLQPRTHVATRSRASRTGALIGLGVGTAAAAVYWFNRGCQYGSDSMSAIVVQCVVPTGAMIGGGWLIGRALGK